MKIPNWVITTISIFISPWVVLEFAKFVTEPYGGIQIESGQVLFLHFVCYAMGAYVGVVFDWFKGFTIIPFITIKKAD